MSEGPIKRERLATTVPERPRIRKGDTVHITTSQNPTAQWKVIESDLVTALLDDGAGRRVKRFCRDLARVQP